MQAANRERVLLVDDEPQVLVALEDLLCDQFVVFKSESADSALQVVERERDIAVVITDQRMPRMNGDELLKQLGDSSNATRILVTGYADLSAVIRAVNDGRIFAYVTKPWNADDLRLKVTKAAQHFRMARELAYERQLLHDLMDNIPDGIYFKDADLRFRRANRAFGAMLEKQDAAGLVGKRLEELVLGETGLEDYERQERRILMDGEPTLDVLREYKRRDGREYCFSETKAPIRSPSGEVIGIVGISRDVTERVAMSNALRTSETRFREQSSVLNSILDSMADGVVVTDREGCVLLLNRQAENLLGTPSSDLSPSDWHTAFGMSLFEQKVPLPADQNPLLRAIREEQTVTLVVQVQNGRVSDATLEITAAPLRGEDERLNGAVALLRDVTQQRELEQQLAQSQKMEAIGQLAGGVAHDFNNMLSVIQSYAQLLLRDFTEGDPRREDVGQVLAASQRAAALTRQLLAFCRRQVVQPKLLQLNDVVAELDKMLRRVIGHDIDLELSLSHSLGVVKADPTQVEQIVLNLAINARDAMPDGGKLVIETMNVVLAPEYLESHAGVTAGDYIMLGVTDNGIGMDAATQKRIFEPFFTTKEVGRGTGLGLSTVYGIVRQSGGHIGVTSAVGRGTSFKVYLPRVDERSVASVRAGSEAPVSDRPATIFLVEDDSSVRQIAARILREQGYVVLEAGRVAEARALFSQRVSEIQLLLIDVVMPDTTGPKLAEEFVAQRPGLPVVFMSGYSNWSSMPSALSKEGASYLDKPFTPTSLTEKVREALARVE